MSKKSHNPNQNQTNLTTTLPVSKDKKLNGSKNGGGWKDCKKPSYVR
jgi:hypothetical protein